MPFANPSTQTYLAFDYGERRIGVAVGQAVTGTATPVVTLHIKQHSPNWDAIGSLIDEWEPDALIVGLPPSLGDSSERLAAKITAFCQILTARFARPVHTIDESFTSTEAYHRLRTQRRLGRKKALSKEEIDRWAAVIILESWMATRTNEIAVG